MLSAVAVVAIAVVTIAVRARSGPSVSESQARAFLGRAVEVGLARDYDALCAMNGSAFNCRMTLTTGVIHAPATTPPTSVTARYVDTSANVDVPGWLLTVRGLDGTGRPYDTEVMVFRDDEDALKAINVVWWSGARVDLTGGPEEGDAPPPG